MSINKYRAWDNEEHKWLTDFIISSDGSVYKCGRDYEDGLESKEIILEQYIGIKDKNGKEYCNGDIAILGENKPCMIKYDNDRACFTANFFGHGNAIFHISFWEKGEIIGTIHDFEFFGIKYSLKE